MRLPKSELEYRHDEGEARKTCGEYNEIGQDNDIWVNRMKKAAPFSGRGLIPNG